MRKAIVIPVSIICLCAVILSVIFLSGIFTENNEPSVNIVEKKKTTYTLKAYYGKLGVFMNDEEQPTEIIECDISILPEIDRDNLTKGITVESRGELMQLIEDLTS